MSGWKRGWKCRLPFLWQKNKTALFPLSIFFLFLFPVHAKELTFRWKAVDGAKVYQVQVSKSPDLVPLELDASSWKAFIVINLASGTFYYRVRAFDINNQEGLWSLTQKVYVGPGSPEFTFPKERITVLNGDQEELRLNWELRNSKEDPPLSYILKMNNQLIFLNKNSYVIKRPRVGRYIFSVKAKTTLGKESEYSEEVDITVNRGKLTLLKPKRSDIIRDVRVQFSWTPTPTAEAYVLYIFKDANLKTLVKKIRVRGNQDTISFLPSGKYYWFVKEVSKGQELKQGSSVGIFETVSSAYF